jgi:hypothetical protein
MKNKIILPKKDVLVLCFCIMFMLLCLGAIGANGRHRAKMILCQLNEKKMVKVFDILGYGQIEDYIDREDLYEDYLTYTPQYS